MSLPHRRLQSPGKVNQKVVVIRIKHGCIDDRREDELIWRLQITGELRGGLRVGPRLNGPRIGAGWEASNRGKGEDGAFMTDSGGLFGCEV